MSILVVEDDEAVGVALAGALREEGYEVEIATDGREALARLEGGAAPSLILLDLMMPRMDGLAFRERQLADHRLAGIPVIVMSAHPDAKATAKRIGAADAIAKPMQLDELLLVVQNTAITVVTSTALPGSPQTIGDAWEALRGRGSDG